MQRLWGFWSLRLDIPQSTHYTPVSLFRATRPTYGAKTLSRQRARVKDRRGAVPVRLILVCHGGVEQRGQ